MKIFFSYTTVITCAFLSCELSFAYDSCKGNKQTVVIPDNYDKDVPDSYQTGNTTYVRLGIYISRLKNINEDRYHNYISTSNFVIQNK